MGRHSVMVSDEEREVLDLVSKPLFAKGAALSLNELLLEYSVDRSDSVKATVDALVGREYLTKVGVPNAPELRLSRAGLMATTAAGRVATFVERLLGYLKHRFASEKAQFKAFTWAELIAARVADDDAAFGLVAASIDLFNLTGHSSIAYDKPSAQWTLPSDAAELRSIDDVEGLVRRVEKAHAAWPAVVAPAPATATPPFGAWHQVEELGRGRVDGAVRAMIQGAKFVRGRRRIAWKFRADVSSEPWWACSICEHGRVFLAKKFIQETADSLASQQHDEWEPSFRAERFINVSRYSGERARGENLSHPLK